MQGGPLVARPLARSPATPAKERAQHRQASAAAQKEAAAKVAAQQKQEEDQAKLAHAEEFDAFQRAFAACMGARKSTGPLDLSTQLSGLRR